MGSDEMHEDALIETSRALRAPSVDDAAEQLRCAADAEALIAAWYDSGADDFIGSGRRHLQEVYAARLRQLGGLSG